jgi:hypothetical protein
MDQSGFERALVDEVRRLPISRWSHPEDVCGKPLSGYPTNTRATEEVTFRATTDKGHLVELGFRSIHWESDLATAMKNYERQRRESSYYVWLAVDGTRVVEVRGDCFPRRNWLGRLKRGLYFELGELYWSLHDHLQIREKQSGQAGERLRLKEQEEARQQEAEGRERAEKLRDWF